MRLAGVMEHRRDGFSLVETVVAMLVGTMALIALAGVMVSSSQVQSVSLSRMELTAIGETKLDQLRAYSALRTADTLQLAIGGSLTSDVANHTGVMTSARGRQYRLRWTVAAGLNGTRDVTLRAAPLSPRPNEVAYVDLRTLMLLE